MGFFIDADLMHEKGPIIQNSIPTDEMVHYCPNASNVFSENTRPVSLPPLWAHQIILRWFLYQKDHECSSDMESML